MMRASVFVAALCLAAFPQALSCGESKPADATVHTRDGAKKALVETRTLELPYGDGADSLGFSAAFDEREALGPIAIEVRDDGAIRIADTLRRKVFDVRVDARGRARLSVAGSMSGLPEVKTGGVPTTARAIKTSGEDGAILFTERGSTRRIAIRTFGPLASMRLIGLDRKGRAFVLVEKFHERGKTAIDREVIVVDAEGALIAKTALPKVSAVRPLVELFLTPEGALYRLAADADAARVTIYEVTP